MPALRVTSRARIKHGPRLAGVFVDVAGVVAVVRAYGASLLSRMVTYINLFIGIIPCNSGGRLQYSNLPNFLRGMNGINLIVYGDRTGGT